MGLQPDGDPLPPPVLSDQHAQPAGADNVDFSLRQALRTSAFWFITAATAIRVIVLSAVNVHFVALMVWTGMSPQRAAVFLAIQAFMALLVACSFRLAWR